MGNKILKDKLKGVYDIRSSKKTRFIRTFKKPNISLLSFINNQFKYINKKIFLFSFAYFIILVILLFLSSYDQFILFASGIPFLSLVIVAAISSSKNSNMEELEMTTLYSLKMIILARMLVVALYTIVFMGLIAILTSSVNHISILKILVFFFVPYLFSMYLNLVLLQKYRKDGFKYCFVSSFSVWIFELFIIKNLKTILFFSNHYLVWLLIIVIVLLIHETRKYLDRLEDFVWNL